MKEKAILYVRKLHKNTKSELLLTDHATLTVVINAWESVAVYSITEVCCEESDSFSTILLMVMVKVSRIFITSAS